MRRDHAATPISLPSVGLTLLVLTALVGASACPKVPSLPPPTVKAWTVVQRTTPVSTTLVGQVAAYLEVELRAKVGGILEKRLFEPGAMVRKGQPLFVIDRRPYQASLDNAVANLAKAESALLEANQNVDRYRPLLDQSAIPKQTFDTADSQAKQAAAMVEAAKAAVEQARLNLDNATIESPLDGQIGKAEIDVGGLVQQGQTVLAKLSQNHPAYVYFSISEREFLFIAERELARAKTLSAQSREYPVRLILADGTQFAHEGKLDFADRAVTPQTGTLTLRALFPNPDQLLRPGMYGKVVLVYDTRENAVLVPQKAVKEVLGKYFVVVVGAGNLPEDRAVRMGPRVGEWWIVNEGLAAGERIVVEGIQKVKAGTTLNIETLTDEALLAPAGQ